MTLQEKTGLLQTPRRAGASRGVRGLMVRGPEDVDGVAMRVLGRSALGAPARRLRAGSDPARQQAPRLRLRPDDTGTPERGEGDDAPVGTGRTVRAVGAAHAGVMRGSAPRVARRLR